MLKNKSKINFIIKLIIAISLLSWFLSKCDLKIIFDSLLNITLSILCLTIILNYLSIFVNSYKWKILLPEFNLFNLFKINLIGQFFNTLLPGQVAGEAAKAYLLGKGKEESDKVVASVFIDKITGVIGLLILGTIGLILTKLQIPQGFSISIILCILIVIFILFSIRVQFIYTFLIKILNKLSLRFLKLSKYFNHTIEIINSWNYYLRKPELLFISVIWGIIYQLFGVIIIYLLANEFQIYIPIIDWFWILAIISVILLLPISIGGVGVREGALIGILGFIDISNEKALALSFAIYGLQLILAITGGIVYINLRSK